MTDDYRCKRCGYAAFHLNAEGVCEGCERGLTAEQERAAFNLFADALANHDHGRHCRRCAGVLVKDRRMREALDEWINRWGDVEEPDPLVMWEELKAIREGLDAA